MKILLCHNYYQRPGGEDQSFAAEAALLQARGHEVLTFTRHNDAIDGMSRLSAAAKTLWNRQVGREIRELIRRERPEIMHCTNTFPLLSAAAAHAARAEGVPVVQSLRNYRLSCVNGLLLRDGKVCESCLGRSIALPGIWRACYRDSRAASAVVAGATWWQRWLDRWRPAVTLYFTPTEFARAKLIEGGLPAARIAVKPNFIDPDPGLGGGAGGYVVFVGRLSEEKGIDTLLAAWRMLEEPIRLKIVGDGPLADMVAAAAADDPRIEWLGHRSPAEVLSIVGDATCLVMPSVYYETFGRTIAEAFARATPVVVSRLGAMAELVRDGQTGFRFEPGNAADLVAKLRTLLADPARLAQMRDAARAEYLAKYTAAINYELLMSLYHRALDLHAGTRPVEPQPAPDRPVRQPKEPVAAR